MPNNFKFTVEAEIPAGAVQALEDAAKEAFMDVAAELDGRFQSAITSDSWSWPRQSKRGVSGSTLKEKSKNWRRASYNTGTTRNIVDSGDLAQSHVFNVSGLKAEYVWTASHAAWVHEGARIKPWGNQNAATVTLPARPWTTAVLKGGNPSIPVYDFSSELARKIPYYL